MFYSCIDCLLEYLEVLIQYKLNAHVPTIHKKFETEKKILMRALDYMEYYI